MDKITFDPDRVNFVELSKPRKFFKFFDGNPNKVVKLSEKLLLNELYLPDEMRDPQRVAYLLQAYFCGGMFNMFYEIGNFGGIMGVINISPTYKADLIFKLWDKEIWGATLAREIKDVIDLVAKEFQLKRIAGQTPDERMVKMFENFGFKIEGRQKFGFRWNQKDYTNFLMRKLY